MKSMWRFCMQDPKYISSGVSALGQLQFFTISLTAFLLNTILKTKCLLVNFCVKICFWLFWVTLSRLLDNCIRMSLGEFCLRRNRSAHQ